MNQLEIQKFVQAAIEATVYLQPRDPGLSFAEIKEVGKQAGYLEGELGDAVLRNWQGGRTRYMPQASAGPGLNADFNWEITPDYRNPKAFEFVRIQLQELARSVGVGRAQLARDVLVERGVAAGFERNDLEVAISVLVLEEIFHEKGGIVRHAPQKEGWILPSKQIESRDRGRHAPQFDRSAMARAYPIVRDVLDRRSSARLPAAQPLDAFEQVLSNLGHERFRMWWIQKRLEIRLADPSLQPATILVLSASLAEAALSFLVPRASKHGLMKRIDVTKPRLWRFADLVAGSKSGDPTLDAILDDRTAQRALDLNETRQRIHAGYLIDTTPTGPIPDLKPEEALDAQRALDTLVRKILDWLDRNPS